jgi:hypothetical protein
VFLALVDLGVDPSWSSIEITRLTVPDGALREGDRFLTAVALAEWSVDLRCRVVRLGRPVEFAYKVFPDEELMLRLIQHLTPVLEARSRGGRVKPSTSGSNRCSYGTIWTSRFSASWPCSKRSPTPDIWSYSFLAAPSAASTSGAFPGRSATASPRRD